MSELRYIFSKYLREALIPRILRGSYSEDIEKLLQRGYREALTLKMYEGTNNENEWGLRKRDFCRLLQRELRALEALAK